MAKASFHFECAVHLDDEQSSAVSFFGVFDKGRKATFVTKDGIGYTYDLGAEGDKITKENFDNLLSQSIGKFWVKSIKPRYDVVDKDEHAFQWNITSDYWYGEKQAEEFVLEFAPRENVNFPNYGLFAF